MANGTSSVMDVVQKNKIKLLVIEMTKRKSSIQLIKELKSRFPQLVVLLIDDMNDQQFLASAFQLGVKDAFHKPCKIDLLVERVTALLG